MYKRFLSHQINVILENAKILLTTSSADLKTGDETLHDFRVALRRFFTIFNIIKKRYPLDQPLLDSAVKLKELRDNTNILRDLEVITDNIAKKTLEGSMGEDAIKLLNIHLFKKLQKEYDLFIDFLSSIPLDDIIASINEWLNQFDGSIDFNGYIKKMFNRIKKALSAEPTDEKIHEIRINFKRIRYILEMMDKVKDTHHYDTLKQIQDTLGHYNDLICGAKILHNIPYEKIVGSKLILYATGYFEASFLCEKVMMRDEVFKKIKNSLKSIKSCL